MRFDHATRREFVKGSLAAAATLGFGRSAQAAIDPRTGMDDWRRNMLTYGDKYGRFFLESDPEGPIDPLLGPTYYDAQRVFYQIGDFTGEKIWSKYAEAAMKIYRDRYVIPNKGKIPGYWNFSRGIAMNYERTKDPKSREAVMMLADGAAYAGDAVAPNATKDAGLSRETAYAIHDKLDLEAVGEPRSPRLTILVDLALGHIDQWFVAKTAKYLQPFMTGLTAEALIRYDAVNPDPRVLPALKKSAVYLWNHLWLPKEQTFPYLDREVKGEGGPTPAEDLNLLIAPMYAWIYHQTGDVAYRDRAVAIFARGVKKAFLGGGKQFNQNYRWSFDYVKWVTEKPKSSTSARRK